MIFWDYIYQTYVWFFFFGYQENYGKADQARVEKVKELYKALDLQVSLPAFS